MNTFPLQLFAGALLGTAAALIFYRQSRRFLRGYFTVTLVIAAVIYLAFAGVGVYAGTADFADGVLEAFGVLTFFAIAFAGWRRSPAFLSIGWFAHILWDTLFHPHGSFAYVPEFYPGVCIGFDFVFGVFIVYYFYFAKRS